MNKSGLIVYFFFIFIALLIRCEWNDSNIYLGMGAKVGEMTDSSAIVHVRLTQIPELNSSFVVPGQTGYVRLIYGLDDTLDNAVATEWQKALKDNDFFVNFYLNGLKPGARYYFQLEMKKNRFDRIKRTEIGSFKTAPALHVRHLVKFQVTTGQDFRGIYTYTAMREQEPDFLVIMCIMMMKL